MSIIFRRFQFFLQGIRSLSVRLPYKRYLVRVIGIAAVFFCCFFIVKNTQALEIFRVGFTYQAFGGVNENDAMAAVRAWAQAFVTERNIQATPEPSIYRSLSEIEAALSHGSVEAINMTLIEYSKMRAFVADDVIICGVISDSITEEYLLLVNRKSNIKELSDLKGKSIGLLSSQRASLAATWLDTLLLREGLVPADNFFSRVDTDTKVGNMLIPVFFGKLDACVVTRKGFEIMVELNPQTGKQLVAIKSSTPLVPSVFCFRKDYTSNIRNQILDEIQRWHLSPAGKQSLTIFQTDSLMEQSLDCLDSALELIDEYEKLMDAKSVHLTKKSIGDAG